MWQQDPNHLLTKLRSRNTYLLQINALLELLNETASLDLTYYNKQNSLRIDSNKFAKWHYNVENIASLYGTRCQVQNICCQLEIKLRPVLNSHPPFWSHQKYSIRYESKRLHRSNISKYYSIVWILRKVLVNEMSEPHGTARPEKYLQCIANSRLFSVSPSLTQVPSSLQYKRLSEQGCKIVQTTFHKKLVQIEKGSISGIEAMEKKNWFSIVEVGTSGIWTGPQYIILLL